MKGTYIKVVNDYVFTELEHIKEENKGKTAYFGAVNNARFKRKVVPGDKLKMECEIIKKKGPVGVGKAVATVDGEVALTAELTFMVG